MDADAKVWIDGEIVELSEARVPVLDHGFLYGDGVFEGIRVYGGRVFRLSDHLRRLDTGARAIGLTLPGSVSGLEKIVLDTARAYGRDEAYIRLIVTRGEGELGVDPATCETPRVVCIAAAITLFSEQKLRRGLDLATASVRRPPADVLDPGIKSLNYLNSVLAKREARLRGADEALILNGAGMVAEASVANVFMVRGAEVATPPTSDGALPGITRMSVLELAEREGFDPHVRTLARVDLLGADEVFLTGTGARIVPVASIDGQPIGESGRGPVMARLDEAFSRYVVERGTAF